MNQKTKHLLWACIPAVITITALIQGIWQYHHNGSVVFFGDDTFAHLANINNLKSGALHVGLGSSILFEWIVWKWSILFHTDIVRTYSAFAILSLPALIASISFLLYQVFNPAVAAISAFLLAFVSIQPVQTYQDGTIPDLYAIGALFPLALLLLYVACNSNGWKRVLNGAGSAGFLLLILFTHHLSTLVILITFLGASLLFTAWLTSRLTSNRWRAFIPVTALLIGLWFILVVIRPEAVLRILSLVGSFSGHFPWFTFAIPAHLPLPWNAVRYGDEVSGIVFQLGLAAIPLFIWKLKQEKRVGKALILSILIGWILLYWLGSLTARSAEPDRLARDFALPGCILAGYAIWWLYTTFFRRYSPAVIAFFCVLMVSASFSGNHRLSLMTNHPQQLYTAEDEMIVAQLADLQKPVTVYSPNFFWLTVATSRNHSFTSSDTAKDVGTFITNQPQGCIVQIYYKVVIAGGAPNQKYAEPLTLPSTYTRTVYDSQARRLFLSCPTASTPSANKNQNI